MADTQFLWQPLRVAEAARVFDPLDIRWWVAGGEALDLAVGRATRTHGDLDIAVLRRDIGVLAQIRSEWDVHIAHDGRLRPWDGSVLADDMHQFWVRRYGAEAWAFEVLLEQTDGDEWVFRRDHRVRRALSTIGHRSEDGIPFLAPEICLLYKAGRPGSLEVERNEVDLEMAAPLLAAEARGWLRATLEMVVPGHAWIDRVSTT
jgi:hypothetical protein